MQPTVDHFFKFPKFTLPNFSEKPLEWAGQPFLFSGVFKTGIESTADINNKIMVCKPELSVSNCVNLLTINLCVGDLTSESFLHIA